MQPRRPVFYEDRTGENSNFAFATDESFGMVLRNMNKFFSLGIFFLVFCLSASAQIKIGGRTLDSGKLLEAGKNVVAAVTLSDVQIARLSAEAVARMDAENTLAADTSAYAVRLKRLTERVGVEGLDLNFKVYLTEDINAFACGDGSVRVFSGLMDRMDDDELMAVVGHEIGHVVNTDSKDAMKNAYLRAAGRSALGAAGGTLAKLTDSQWGTIAEALASAQYSQKQETAADAYGVNFCHDHGLDPYAMSRALEKLDELSQQSGTQASILQRMFSDHPDNVVRVERTRALADEIAARHDQDKENGMNKR